MNENPNLDKITGQWNIQDAVTQLDMEYGQQRKWAKYSLKILFTVMQF